MAGSLHSHLAIAAHRRARPASITLTAEAGVARVSIVDCPREENLSSSLLVCQEYGVRSKTHWLRKANRLLHQDGSHKIADQINKKCRLERCR